MVDDADHSATPAIQEDVEMVKHVGQALKTNNNIVVSVGDTDYSNREAAGETQVCVWLI